MTMQGFAYGRRLQSAGGDPQTVPVIQAGSVVATARRDELEAADRVRFALLRGDASAGAYALADWIDARALLEMFVELEADDSLRMGLN